ncbi:hypothetical protein LCUFL03_330270 [Latilactobacillus curvatus]|nr:hypothetical protein LCUFL03_330270 [Latilactobacillus curvatus]
MKNLRNLKNSVCFKKDRPSLMGGPFYYLAWQVNLVFLTIKIVI